MWDIQRDAARYLAVTAAAHLAKLEGWLATRGTLFLLGRSPSAPDFPLFGALPA